MKRLVRVDTEFAIANATIQLQNGRTNCRQIRIGTTFGRQIGCFALNRGPKLECSLDICDRGSPPKAVPS